VRIVFAVMLMLEGFSSGMRLLQFIPVFVVYSWFTVTLLLVRGGVGVLQFAGGWSLLQKAPVGPRLGRTALVVSAVLTMFEIGFRMTPTSLFPSYRWPFVAAYWLYALVGVWVLKRHPVS